MPNGRKVALLVAVAAALYGIDARADEPQPGQAKPKTVEELVNEARARVEAKARAEQGAPVSDWMRYQKADEIKEQQPKQEPKAYYLSLGNTRWSRASLGELRRIRSAQRDSAALPYTERPEDFLLEPDWAATIVGGVELNRWLDVELTLVPVHQDWEINDGSNLSPASDGTSRQSTHHSSYDETSYTLTFMPRWNIHKAFAVFARLGVGYASNELRSTLAVQGQTGTKEVCTQDPQNSAKQNCRNQAVFGSVFADDFNRKESGFYPIVGVGFDLFQMFRVDYTFRTNLPLQGSDISTGTAIWLTVATSRWGDGSWAF